MFQHNMIGRLSPLTGRDGYAREIYGTPIDCPFGAVNLEVGTQKTSVRADSSASRGAADEIATMRAKILVVPYVTIKIGDRFEFDGITYRIQSKHTRRSVLGNIDHFECSMEIVPE